MGFFGVNFFFPASQRSRIFFRDIFSFFLLTEYFSCSFQRQTFFSIKFADRKFVSQKTVPLERDQINKQFIKLGRKLDYCVDDRFG